MKVGDLVRWRSWDKRERVGLVVRLGRTSPATTLWGSPAAILWVYTHTGEALKADGLEVVR